MSSKNETQNRPSKADRKREAALRCGTGGHRGLYLCPGCGGYFVHGNTRWAEIRRLVPDLRLRAAFVHLCTRCGLDAVVAVGRLSDIDVEKLVHCGCNNYTSYSRAAGGPGMGYFANGTGGGTRVIRSTKTYS